MVYHCRSLCPVLSLHFHHPSYRCCNFAVQLHVVGYNPNHHCCNLAVGEDGALHVVYHSVLMPCSITSLSSSYLPLLYNLVVQDDGALHVVSPSLFLCPLVSLHCNHPVITTVVTWLFRRTGHCTRSSSLCPYALFCHFTFIILLTTVVTWLFRMTECCTWSSSLCPYALFHHFRPIIL